MTSGIKVGTLIRSKDTGSVATINDVGAFLAYDGPECDGHVKAECLLDEFDILYVPGTEPGTQDEIEKFLKAMISIGKAETGLYSTGISYVVVDRVNEEFTFQWFDYSISLTDVVNDANDNE